MKTSMASMEISGYVKISLSGFQMEGMVLHNGNQPQVVIVYSVIMRVVSIALVNHTGGDVSIKL